jgi:hypothetical protein
MEEDTFDAECNRLSYLIDPDKAAEKEWERTDGATLNETVRIAEELFRSRDDLSLVDVDSDPKKRRFLLASKVGVDALAFVNFEVQSGRPVIWAEPLPKGKFTVFAPKPLSSPSEHADEEWVRSAFGQLLGSIQLRDQFL